MKIWKAKLVLFYIEDETYSVKFNFELQEQEYKINDKFKEWIHSKDWICDRVPMNITIERYYDNYKIIQGFDHELNDEELKQLESDMRDLMKKQLNYDKEIYLKKFEDKLKAIRSC